MKRVVLITGVAGGIGSASAQAFSQAGWHVIGVDRRQLDAPTGVHHFIQADVSNMDSSQGIFAEVADKEGCLHALINNAAILISKPLVKTSSEEWDAVMASNLTSVYLSIRNAYPIMRTGGGAIVNVGSVHAIATSANFAAYAASKGGLLSLTRALAIELGPDQIRVNAVLPGAVDTSMLHAGLSRGHVQDRNLPELVEQLARRHPMGKLGQASEIAQAIYFLADHDRSSFMTGQALVVDGGATARLSTE